MDEYYAKWQHPVNIYYCGGRTDSSSHLLEGLVNVNHCHSVIYNKKYIDMCKQVGL